MTELTQEELEFLGMVLDGFVDDVWLDAVGGKDPEGNWVGGDGTLHEEDAESVAQVLERAKTIREKLGLPTDRQV